MKTKPAFAYAYEMIGLDEYTFAGLVTEASGVNTSHTDVLAALSGKTEASPAMWHALRCFWDAAYQGAKRQVSALQREMRRAHGLPNAIYVSDLGLDAPIARLQFAMTALRLPGAVPVKFE